MLKDNDAVIISWDFSKGEDGKDHSVVIVGQKEGGQMRIVNAFADEEAKRIYDFLVTEKIIG